MFEVEQARMQRERRMRRVLVVLLLIVVPGYGFLAYCAYLFGRQIWLGE